MFLRKRPMERRLRAPLLDQIHCFGFLRIERMTGFEPAVSCLGSRRATTAPHPHGRAFSDTSHGGDV